MNDDVLERLMIDKLSGELSPDAAILLEAWIERDVASKPLAARVEETMRLARQVFREREQPAIVRPVFAWKRWASQISAMAACFAVGLLLAALLFHQSPRRAPAEAAVTVAQSDFWSVRRVHPPMGQVAPEASLQWTSPVKKPEWRIRS